MARALPGPLDAAMLTQRRQPGFRIEIFDIRSTSGDPTPTRINQVVLFNLGLFPTLPGIVGPRDFTDDCVGIDVTEQAGDYVSQGIAATSITFTISDPVGDFDPVENPAPNNGRWLRQKNVIVVREGDEQVDDADWPITFTGAIQGQPGQDFNRTTLTAEITGKASSREVDFLRRIGTTRNFTQATTFEDMANEIAETDMGLDLDEINLPSFGTRFTAFLSTQFVDESFLTTIAKIMFPDGFMPRFDGDGRLSATSGLITKGNTRVYVDRELQVTIKRPILEFNGTNSVEILGLDPNLTKIPQIRQELARASITTGFFSTGASIPVSWSDDKTQQAEDVEFVVLSSIGASPIAFGSESFAETIQSDGGSVEGEIEVDGAISAGLGLLSLLTGALIFSLAVPDAVVTAPGDVKPFGRTVTTFVMQAISFILGQAGRGEYRMEGIPYEYVFKEIRGVCQVSGIRSEDKQEITVENHLINSQTDADDAAERILRRERAKQNIRTVEMIHDLVLEPDDIFAVGDGLDQRRYAIRTISRRLVRGGAHTASLNCFEVTVGVRP